MFRSNNYEGVSFKAICLLSGALLFVLIIYHLSRPLIVVESEGKIIFSTNAEAGTEFSSRFIHSVQKTPVEEFFMVNDECSGFILKSTRYQSFGVGLPFLESDGIFRREGDYFIMDNLNRPIKNLDLRPGIGTELTVTIDNQELQLYQLVPLGSLVRISIFRNYKLGMRNFFE